MAKNFLKYFVVVLITINMVILGFVVLGGKSEPVVPLPNPNGYDDFVKAGKISNGKAGYYKSMTQEELRVLVMTNEEALKIVRLGLTRECRAPDDYSPDYITRSLPELMGFKQLTCVLCAEGRLAGLEGRTNDAARIYLEGTRLGQKSSLGTFMFAKLVGIACEGIALQQLRSLTNSLDAVTCREIVETLANLDSKEPSVEENLKQEAAWSHKALGLRDQFEKILQYKTLRESKREFIDKFQANRLQRRQIMIAFAARAYELEKGRSLGSIFDLVPGYLKTIPLDPTTGTNLVYSP